MEAVVLAGGLGTRLRRLVSDAPKPMAPVSGKPFLEYLLRYWISQGVRRFVISVGYLSDRITRHFGTSWGGAQIAYVKEDEPLGTGGGLLLALSQTRSPEVIAMNGDSYFGVDLAAFRAFHEERKADWSVALFRSCDKKRYLGVELTRNGSVARLGTESSAASMLVNGGVYLLRSERFRDLPWETGARSNLESDLLPYAMQATTWRVFGLEFERPFLDIGIPADYLRAPNFLEGLAK